LELQVLMLEAQRALAEAEEENRNLRNELNTRDELKALEVDLVFQEDGAFLVRKSEAEAGKEINYCPVCWGESRKLITLAPTTPGCFECVLHKKTYLTQKYYDRVKERNNRLARPRRTGKWS